MNINEAKQVILHVMKTNPRQAMMIWGLPGVGKSDMVRQIGEATGRKVIESRLSQMDNTDVRGLPGVLDGHTHWHYPAEFPTEADGPTIWFFDEINAGSRSVMASAMQLFLDRRCGSYTVPEDCIMLAAGNRTTDLSVANAMPAALSNRFMHIELEPDLDVWTGYALDHNHPIEIVQFVRFRPDMLHAMLEGKKLPDPRDIKGFPSPRAWSSLAMSNPFAIADATIRKFVIQAAVGLGAMIELEGFLQVMKNLPSLSRILTDPHTAEVPTEASALFAVCGALVKKATETTIDAIASYLQRLPIEFCTMAIKDIAKVHPELTSTAAFTRLEIAISGQL